MAFIGSFGEGPAAWFESVGQVAFIGSFGEGPAAWFESVGQVSIDKRLGYHLVAGSSP